MEFTQEKKQEIEKAIVERCISALEQGAIKEEDLGTISAFVLEKIDNIKTDKELEAFLLELSQKWQIFESLHKIQIGQSEGAQDQAIAHKAEEFAREGNVEEALATVKSASE